MGTEMGTEMGKAEALCTETRNFNETLTEMLTKPSQGNQIPAKHCDA